MNFKQNQSKSLSVFATLLTYYNYHNKQTFGSPACVSVRVLNTAPGGRPEHQGAGGGAWPGKAHPPLQDHTGDAELTVYVCGVGDGDED